MMSYWERNKLFSCRIWILFIMIASFIISIPVYAARIDDLKLISNAEEGGYAGSSYIPMDGDEHIRRNTEGIQLFSTTKKGIDVSYYQGNINWNTVATQIDFAILRCGYGDNLVNQDDTYFKRNADECTRLGIPFGVYIYSYALTDAQALSEAEHVLRLINGYNLTLPVYLDLEDSSISSNCSKDDILRHTRIFCNKIEAAGYNAGVYANYYWWTNLLTSSEYDNWDRWIARYASATGYSKSYSIWQYTSEGSVSGISGYVDMNYWYGDFPSSGDNSSIKISGYNVPGTMKAGDVCSIYGTVNSGKKLTDVMVGIFDMNGNMRTGKSVNPNATSYSLKNIDADVRFNDLSPGVYYYRVTASNSETTIDLVKSVFIVLANDRTIDDGNYVICPTATYSLALDIADHSSASGANVQLGTADESAFQCFTATYVGNGYYTLKNMGSGNCLDVLNAYSSEGANVQQCTKNDGTAQNWQILPAGDGYCLVPQCATSMCLDIAGAELYSGTNIRIWSPNLSIAQRFELVEADLEIEHIYTERVTKEPTCTENGERTYTCTCGESYIEIIDALGHDYKSQLIGATCKDYAVTVYTCSRCKDSYRVAHDSKYSDWSEVYPDGIDESLIESRTEYRYQEKEVQTSYSSSLSGWIQSGGVWEKSGSGTVSYVASWPSGFDTSNNLYSTYNKTPKSAFETATDKTVIDSTATEGYLYYHWCRNTYATGPINRTTKPTNSGEFNCFHAFYSTTNPNTLTASSDGDGSCIYSNGDCCKDTYWYYNVAVNRQTYTTYKKLFNYYRWSDWSDWSTTKATESSTKKVETRTVYRYETSVLGDHVYGEWIVLKEATDLETGLKERTCEVCGNKEVITIPKTDHLHTHVEMITKEATCTEDGIKTFTCTCGNSYTDKILAKGHFLSNWKVVTQETCTEDGLKVKECSRTGCDYKESEVIKASGHAYTGWEVVKEATETEEGLMERTCVNCGKTEEKILNSGDHMHSYVLTDTLKPTCEEDGAKIFTCECGESYSEAIPALGHVLSQWKVETEASCDMDGVRAKICYRDECTYAEREIIRATGHSYGEWTVLEEPTDTEDGVKVRTCADCGNQEFVMIEKLEAKENPFKDVEEDDYYFEPVLWALDHRITSGLTADTFAPQLGATRAEVVTFLWRAHGEPEPELETSSFEDVKETSYYSKAVRWATENGVTNGYNEKEFGSKDYVTRAQFVTFLWRVEGEPEPMSAETTFTDIKTTSYYYKAVLWAVENGITLGYDQSTFAPDMTCTRAQVVTFLYRAYN